MELAYADDEWRLGHRPGLDGLRGIAIGLVLLLHWWPDVFPGGDTGVDLFFVLSGFLITRLLVEEAWTTGTIDLRDFYRRRFRRLMPASTALIACCALTPGAIWVALYSANWARIGGVLRGGPLEHTWSLAIEEQFYLVWPVLVLGLVRLRRPWLAVSLLAGLSAMRRLSLPSAEWLHAVAGTDARADGLLIGCALAMSVHLWRNSTVGVPLALATVPGFVVVVMDGMPLAGWGFTLTALGWAAVVRWGVDAEGWIAARPLVVLGRLSYSLYLWHYPITWLIRDGNMHASSTAGTCLAIALSFAAACASYFGIELRLRSGPRQRSPLDQPTEQAR